MYWLVAALLFFGAYLEGTLFLMPVVLVMLLLLFIMQKETWLFVAALVSGVVVDIFHVQPIGTTSLFYIGFLLLVFLYEKKFEITSYTFVAIAAFLGTMGLSVIHGLTSIGLALITSIVAVSVYFGIRMYLEKKSQPIW